MRRVGVEMTVGWALVVMLHEVGARKGKTVSNEKNCRSLEHFPRCTAERASLCSARSLVKIKVQRNVKCPHQKRAEGFVFHGPAESRHSDMEG